MFDGGTFTDQLVALIHGTRRRSSSAELRDNEWRSPASLDDTETQTMSMHRLHHDQNAPRDRQMMQVLSDKYSLCYSTRITQMLYGAKPVFTRSDESEQIWMKSGAL